MNYQGPILTDSGGFQVFLWPEKKILVKQGLNFKVISMEPNYFYTPEKSIEIQNKLDSDIAMSFAECIPYPADYDMLIISLRTLRWAKRGKAVFNNSNQSYLNCSRWRI